MGASMGSGMEMWGGFDGSVPGQAGANHTRFTELTSLRSQAPPLPPRRPPPSPTQSVPPPSDALSVDRWCRELTTFIATGRLQSIGRIASIVGHLEPKSPSLLTGESSRRRRTLRPVTEELKDQEIPEVDPSTLPPPKLDITRWGHKLGPLSLQLRKNVKSLVYLENLLAPRPLHDLLQLVDISKFDFATIVDCCLAGGDLSMLVPEDRLKQARESPLFLLLLVILYVKLATGTSGASDVASLFSRLKRQPLDIQVPNVPPDLLLSALAERRVRFFNSPSIEARLRQRPAELEAYQRGTLYWNELFENAEMIFLSNSWKTNEFVERVRNTVGNRIAENRPEQPGGAEKALASQEQVQQFEESLERIRMYRHTSPSIVLSNLRLLSNYRTSLEPRQFRLETVELLVDILREFSRPGTFSSAIVMPCLQLLTGWFRLCNDEAAARDYQKWVSRSWRRRPIKEVVLPLAMETVSLVENLVKRCPTDSVFFALCITLLGASVGVVGDTSSVSYDLVLHYLRTEPQAFSQGRSLTLVLSGLGDLMTHAPAEQLREVAALLLRSWALAAPKSGTGKGKGIGKGKEKGKEKETETEKGNGNRGEEEVMSNNNNGDDDEVPLPSLEDGLVVFRLFRYVLVARAMKKESFFTYDQQRQRQRQQQQRNFSSSSSVDGEDEREKEASKWLIGLVEECRYVGTIANRERDFATAVMALFAAGGMIKGISIFAKSYEMDWREHSLLVSACDILKNLVIARALERFASRDGTTHLPPPFPPSSASPISSPQQQEQPFPSALRYAVAVVAVNAEAHNLDLTPLNRKILLDLLLDIYTNDILGLLWAFKGVRDGDPLIHKKIAVHCSGTLYRQARSFTYSLAALFTDGLKGPEQPIPSKFPPLPPYYYPVIETEEQSQVLHRFEMLTEDLYHGWSGLVQEFKAHSDQPFNLSQMRELQAALGTVFLSLHLFFDLVHPRLSGPQVARALSILSHLEFTRLKLALYDNTPRRLALRSAQLDGLANVEKNTNNNNIYGHKIDSRIDASARLNEISDGNNTENLNMLLDLLPLNTSVLKNEGESGRLLFFLSALESVVAMIPPPTLSKELLPFLFILLTVPNIRLNKKAHDMFRALFLSAGKSLLISSVIGPSNNYNDITDPSSLSRNSSPNVHRDDENSASHFALRLVPHYLRTSLDGFGDVLPFENFAETLGAALNAMPPASPLFVFCVNSVADKIQTLLHLQQQQYGITGDQGGDDRRVMTSAAADEDTNHDFKNPEANNTNTSSNRTVRFAEPAHPHAEVSGAQPKESDVTAFFTDKVHSPRPLLLLLFSMLLTADLQILDVVLDTIADVISSGSEQLRPLLCMYVYNIISTNFDYTRKDRLLKWYLSLVHGLGLSKKYIVSKIVVDKAMMNDNGGADAGAAATFTSNFRSQV